MSGRYVAEKHLRWGDATIAPGENVPEGDPHRDYAAMLRNGDIRDLAAPGRQMVDADQLGRIEAKLDQIMAALGGKTEPEPVKVEALEPNADEGGEGEAEEPDGDGESAKPRRGRPPKARV